MPAKPQKIEQSYAGLAKTARNRDSHTGFVDRLRKMVDDAGGQRAFAARVGVSQRAVSLWLQSAEPGRDRLAAIAKATGASLDWLISGRGPKVFSECPPGYVAIPFYDLHKSDGYLRDVSAHPAFLFFDRALLGLEANEQPNLLALDLLSPAFFDADRPDTAADFVIIDRGAADLVPSSLLALSENESYRRHSLAHGLPCAVIAQGRVQVRSVRFTDKPKPIIIFDAAGAEDERRFERDDDLRTVNILGPVRFRAGIVRGAKSQ